jgi:hypothetical protein
LDTPIVTHPPCCDTALPAVQPHYSTIAHTATDAIKWFSVSRANQHNRRRYEPKQGLIVVSCFTPLAKRRSKPAVPNSLIWVRRMNFPGLRPAEFNYRTSPLTGKGKCVSDFGPEVRGLKLGLIFGSRKAVSFFITLSKKEVCIHFSPTIINHQ